MSRLALLGGQKIREEKFPAYIVMDSLEENAVIDVLKSGVLSRFLGTWHEDFYGGPQVQALESEWAETFGVKHAISVNSATSGLFCALGALGVGPGDEVIVPPFTMSATAVAPLVYNAIPVFADIEPDFFCLDPVEIEKKITPATQAIVVVDLFGQPFAAQQLRAIAQKHNLKIIEDCAQAPGALYQNQFAGTLGDIGVYSLNYHKHIHSGEGGIIVTNDDELAEKMRLIRNHAEAVLSAKAHATGSPVDLVNMLGFNYRMTEIEAAIARVQLKKLPNLLEQRLENISYLESKLSQIPGLLMPALRENCKHAFYVHPILFDSQQMGIHRNTFVKAVQAELAPIELRETEGVKVGGGYVKPLYLQPIFQQKSLYKKGCPWSCEHYSQNTDYSLGICPVTENLHFNQLITHELMRPPMTRKDLDDVFNAFAKVWDNRAELKDYKL